MKKLFVLVLLAGLSAGAYATLKNGTMPLSQHPLPECKPGDPCPGLR